MGEIKNGALAPVTRLYGVGEKRAASFAKLGVATVGELIYHFPRGYENRGNVKNIDQAEDGELCALILCVAGAAKTAMIRRGMTLTKVAAVDDTGKCNITFFNQPYVRDVLREGAYFRFYGRVEKKGKVAAMASPAFEPVVPQKPLRALVPVYPLAAGLSQKFMASAVKDALSLAFSGESAVREYLPTETRKKYELAELSYALRNIHEPQTVADAERAKKRLAFDEIYLFALSMLREGKKEKAPSRFAFPKPNRAAFLSRFPYEPTGAQKRTFDELDADMTSGKRMHRLLTGDVGSGKTLCAEYAVYAAVSAGAQAAVMTPTEILARQHFESFAPVFEKMGYGVELLIGAMTAAQKRKACERLRFGISQIVIGTHALIEDTVEFRELGLVIIDEQHRFGAAQRARLAEKSEGCHVLSMSATPIPRTLAFVLYGDFDLSTLDEMPPGRKTVDTFVVDGTYRERLYAFMRKNVEEGGQVYVVCPSVEEQKEMLESESGEKLDVSELYTFGCEEEKPKLFAAVDYAKKLAEEIFPDISVGFVHGKMKSAEKEKAMSAFARGEMKILVSTTVIEVGVNVPAATLMVVENADMFGLAALHQLRGRVGRGEKKSHCVLVSESKSETARTRLKILKDHHDGYKIAELDLSMRGPGDFIAERGGYVRQSGEVSFRLATLSGDSKMLYDAFEAARETYARDAGLDLPENALLKEKLNGQRERGNDL
ncbi:MAG: ATP-dependent DNA helicase RecG [Clostridia bacterium]|nr:ATP-dependent DNA helicase RecG [Clostridia bacterium]